MKRAVFLALALPVVAQAYPYTLDGDRFVRIMGVPEPSGYEYMQREKAYSYLDGVRDSAEGRVWCDVDQLKTPDLAYEMAGEIAKLPAAERKKNASLLLLNLLARKYPCHTGRKP